MQKNEILRKIDFIEKPFRREVNNRYSGSVLKLIRKEKGASAVKKFIRFLHKDYLNARISRKDLVEYLNNEHEWMSGILYICVCELAKEIIKDDNFYYRVGKESLNPNFLHVTTSQIISMNTIYKYVQRQNKNFNNLTEISLDNKKFRNGFAVFYRKTYSHYKKELIRKFGENITYKILYNDCQLTRGVLESIPLRYKKRNAKITKEPKCEARGDKYCELHIEWESEPIMRSLFAFVKFIPNYFRMKEKLIDMENAIKERTEQLDKSKSEIEEAYSKIKMLKVALGEKETEALLNTAFSYIDEKRIAEAEKALSLIIKKEDTVVYQYSTSSLANVYLFNKKRVGKVKDIWTIKRYDDPLHAKIAYDTYKKISEQGRHLNIKVPKFKIPINNYLIVQEIEGPTLHDFLTQYLGKPNCSVDMVSNLLIRQIHDIAFIQSLKFSGPYSIQRYRQKMAHTFKVIFDFYKVAYDSEKIWDFSDHLTKNFKAGLLRHRDSSLKNTKVRLFKPEEGLQKRSSLVNPELYQIDFEKMGRLTFQSDNILRITESPVLKIPEERKMNYHHLFLFYHNHFNSNKILPSGKGVLSRKKLTKDDLVNIIGIKKYNSYFLSHNEKVFYRNMRGIYHRLRYNRYSPADFEHISYHREEAVRSLEKIDAFSRKFKDNLAYVKDRFEKIQI
ncbi:MAG: hypothetical protein ABIC04_03615 [Nanoarchaeota archaeon]